MLNFLNTIPYAYLTLFAVIMFILPVMPMPHAIEKIIMLFKGTLHRPIDIFDLFFHLFPTILLLVKLFIDKPWK